MNVWLAAELAGLVAAFAVWIGALRGAWRASQPARLLLAGRYPEARAAAERLGRSWLRVFPSVRHSARYTIGCALHLEGDLEGSSAMLAPLLTEKRLPPIVALEAANLVLLERDHARAAALLGDVTRRAPEDVLVAAHARLGAGEREAAERLFDAAGEGRTTQGLLLQRTMFHALRGLFLVKLGRRAEAQRDLELAARSPLANVYVERARALLERPDDEPEDPRSSLAPQVLAEKGFER